MKLTLSPLAVGKVEAEVVVVVMVTLGISAEKPSMSSCR
jgi:hypothetical protein